MGSGDGNTTMENGSELFFTKIVDDKDQIVIFPILYWNLSRMCFHI